MCLILLPSLIHLPHAKAALLAALLLHGHFPEVMGGLHGCTCASCPEGNLYSSLTASMLHRIPELNCVGTSPPSEQRSPTWHKSSSLEHSMLLTHGEVATPPSQGHSHLKQTVNSCSTQSCTSKVPNQLTLLMGCIKNLLKLISGSQYMSRRTCWHHNAHNLHCELANDIFWSCMFRDCHSDLQRGQDVVVSQNKSDHKEILFPNPKLRSVLQGNQNKACINITDQQTWFVLQETKVCLYT